MKDLCNINQGTSCSLINCCDALLTESKSFPREIPSNIQIMNSMIS